MGLELTWMTPADAERVQQASHLFDHDVRRERAEAFLAQPNHHLCIAAVGAEPAGFVSGMEILHPDKGAEMLLYELGVDEAFRRRGIGRALIGALLERARGCGCTGMWVPVDDGDEPALATYRSTDPDDRDPAVIVWWDLADAAPGEPA